MSIFMTSIPVRLEQAISETLNCGQELLGWDVP